MAKLINFGQTKKDTGFSEILEMLYGLFVEKEKIELVIYGFGSFKKAEEHRIRW